MQGLSPVKRARVAADAYAEHFPVYVAGLLS
jgi:hypothetical protein